MSDNNDDMRVLRPFASDKPLHLRSAARTLTLGPVTGVTLRIVTDGLLTVRLTRWQRIAALAHLWTRGHR